MTAGRAPPNTSGTGPREAFRASCETAAGAFGPNCGVPEVFYDTAQVIMRVNGQPRSSFVTVPANGRIPRKPNTQAAGQRPRGGQPRQP